MPHTIVDVTMRDGGFAVGFEWPQDVVNELLLGLSMTGVDYIELGYLGGLPEAHDCACPGMFSDLDLDYVRALTVRWSPQRFALMVHPSALDAGPDWLAVKQAGVDLVRFVYHPDWSRQIEVELAAASEAALIVSANLALASRYTADGFSDSCRLLAALAPDIVYIADTCAGLLPDQVRRLVGLAREIVDGPIGFHAHDFLALGLANSLEAVLAGAQFIDSSVGGVGRGAGNLKTELWATVVATRRLGRLHPLCLRGALRQLDRLLGTTLRWDLSSMLAGGLNLSPPQEALVRKTAQVTQVDPTDLFWSIAEHCDSGVLTEQWLLETAQDLRTSDKS